MKEREFQKQARHSLDTALEKLAHEPDDLFALWLADFFSTLIVPPPRPAGLAGAT